MKSKNLILLTAISNGLQTFIGFFKNVDFLKDEKGEKLNKLSLLKVILQIVLQILMIGTTIAVTIQQSGDNESGKNPERTIRNENNENP